MIGLRLGVYPPSQVLQTTGRLYHYAPASLCCRRSANSRAPSLQRHYPPSSLLQAHLPPSRLSAPFPVFPVIGLTLLRRFLSGTRRASPVARRFLVTVLPLPPRRSGLPHRSDGDRPCCLRLKREDSASGDHFLSRPPMGSLALRPGDSLTIPRMALSIGFTSFVSSAHATQATGLLTLTPVGLAPTENASLCWTHSVRKIPSR